MFVLVMKSKIFVCKITSKPSYDSVLGVVLEYSDNLHQMHKSCPLLIIYCKKHKWELDMKKGKSKKTNKKCVEPRKCVVICKMSHCF